MVVSGASVWVPVFVSVINLLERIFVEFNVGPLIPRSLAILTLQLKDAQ